MRERHVELELIANEPLRVGEGPLWHEDEQRLYWVDINGKKLFRYNPASGGYETVLEGHTVGGYTIQADGSLLLFMNKGRIRLLKDGELHEVVPDIADDHVTRFNDVIADPEGRVFCGTMPFGSRPGHLYRLDPDGTITTVLSGLGISNGMGFSPDLTTMYHTDTTARTITAFDYDRATGEITNPRVIVHAPEGVGMPDGMTVDTDGTIWSAHWDGWALYHYEADGTPIERIPFPTKKVSSVTFGGPDYRDAYVTTAGGDDRAENGELAGSLFRLDLGVQGRPPFRSRLTTR